MTLELTQEERDVIRELLSQELAELGPEIHHTRTRSYRDELKRRKRTIERLLERIGLPPGAGDQPPQQPADSPSETAAEV